MIKKYFSPKLLPFTALLLGIFWMYLFANLFFATLYLPALAEATRVWHYFIGEGVGAAAAVWGMRRIGKSEHEPAIKSWTIGAGVALFVLCLYFNYLVLAYGFGAY
ncbi:MAG: hypothetical protein GF419_05880 [Ignavibacteriales bacterium]|nr:hypothetical protein [Ignavibacteriales bacterium]